MASPKPARSLARPEVAVVRAHVKKAPLRKDRFDLNDVIKEVIVLAQAAIIKAVAVAPHQRAFEAGR